jgi:hypothetical protein
VVPHHRLLADELRGRKGFERPRSEPTKIGLAPAVRIRRPESRCDATGGGGEGGPACVIGYAEARSANWTTGSSGGEALGAQVP